MVNLKLKQNYLKEKEHGPRYGCFHQVLLNMVVWPMSGEIDIMEHVGYLQNIIHSNVHCQKYNGLDGSNKGWGKKSRGC